MKSEVISTFKGKINNCEFYDENAFYITQAVLNFIIETHGEVFNDAYIHDLADYVYYLLNEYAVKCEDIQGALEGVVDSYDTFQELKFNVFDFENKYMNDKFKKGAYDKK